MESLLQTIAQYEASCHALRGRIAQLNDRISGRAPVGEGESAKALEKRRYLLYIELADMENTIFHIKEYLLAVSGGGKDEEPL